MKKPIAVLTALLVLAAFARYHVFRLQDKEIAPEFYQRKMKLEDFWLPGKSIPSGFSLARALPIGGENPSVLEPDALAKLPKPHLPFPAADKIDAVHIAAYTGTLGDQVMLVAAEYPPAEAPESAPSGFLRDGPFLVTAHASSPVLSDTFLNTLSERLSKLKKDSVKLNKLKTIGNVLLKLFMDILVGAFAFILALFLAKYFLILKRVEE